MVANASHSEIHHETSEPKVRMELQFTGKALAWDVQSTGFSFQYTTTIKRIDTRGKLIISILGLERWFSS